MFLNISTGGDLKRIVVRLCACLLIVGLVGQALIVGPIPRVVANATQLSAPPEPFTALINAEPAENAEDGNRSFSKFLSLAVSAASAISMFATGAAKSKENNATGFENAVLEPLYKESENGKWKTDNGKTVDSEDSSGSPDSPDSFDPDSEVLNPQSPAPPPAGDVEFDFDGDNKADIGRWRGVANEFKVKNSSGSGSGGYSIYTLGSTGNIAAPGDFNGDGTTDACVFNGTTWTYKTSPTATAQTISFGSAGDIPYVGDYDGDSTSDAAIFRPSTNTWWIRQSSNSATVSYQWGATGDIPITGNWDSDSKTDIAVYRPSNGTWYIQASTAGGIYLNWGLSYDIPVQGDFDGDGKSDVTVFRPTTGTWYILKSSSGFTAYSTANWGVWSDQPTPADYDGDGKTDLAIWRPTDGNWYILRSSDNDHEIHALGISGDTAVPSAYTKQVGGTASGDVINAERVKARNATGGTNLYSQNFGWGASLVGLPGRAGLDAGFGIGYNSLIWLKVGNAMYFDPDKGNVTPGFRMGAPSIEPIYYDNNKQKWAYMMVTPSGSRIEFRQTAASNV